MLDDEVIREFSLAGKNDRIKFLMISPRDRVIRAFVVNKREATASDVAKEFNISIQNASGTLTKLYRKGYFRRNEQLQDSGGYEWVYYL